MSGILFTVSDHVHGGTVRQYIRNTPIDQDVVINLRTRKTLPLIFARAKGSEEPTRAYELT